MRTYHVSNASFNVIYFDILPVIMANLQNLNIRDLQVVLEGLVRSFARINKSTPELEIILDKLLRHLEQNKTVPAAFLMSVVSSLKFLRYDHEEIYRLTIERIKTSKRLQVDSELVVYVAKVCALMG